LDFEVFFVFLYSTSLFKIILCISVTKAKIIQGKVTSQSLMWFI
jgi:hypothetical protein